MHRYLTLAKPVNSHTPSGSLRPLRRVQQPIYCSLEADPIAVLEKAKVDLLALMENTLTDACLSNDTSTVEK